MRSLHSQQGLNSEGHGQVEARLGVFEVEAGDLADAVEAVAKGVRVDPEALRGVLLLAGLEVRTERRHQRSLTRGVVLHQRAEMAAAVVDEAFVAHRRQQSRQT